MKEQMKIFKKYVEKHSQSAANTRPDLAVYVMDLARRQKQAVLKDLRDVTRILKRVEEKENKVTFGSFQKRFVCD